MLKKYCTIGMMILFLFMIAGNRSDITTEKTALAAEEGDIRSEEEKANNANSFRFRNGQPIGVKPLRKAAEAFVPWSKVEGGFINSAGNIIPNATKKGIDVSVWNGTIDWSKVKASDVDYAIIRCGYGQDMTNQDDSTYLQNVTACENLEIPYGIYLYSYADTVEKAAGEANHVLRLLAGRHLSLPVYYDMEDKVQEKLTAAKLNNIAQTFCSALEAQGHTVGVYASRSWFESKLTGSVFETHHRWVADWASLCQYKGTYTMWQCTDSGTVPGISGNVDLNFITGEIDITQPLTPVIQKPAAVSGFSYTPKKSNVIKLSWNKLSDIAGYTVYGYDADAKQWVEVASPSATKTSVSISAINNKKLKAATKYKFRIAAYKMVENEKLESEKLESVKLYGSTVTLKTITKPAKVKLKSLKKKNYNNLKITWKKDKNVKGYIIYSSRKKGSGYKVFKKVKGAKSTSYTAKGMTTGVNIYFKVRSYVKYDGKTVYSEYSNIKKIKLKR